MPTVSTTELTLTQEQIDLAAREFVNSFRKDILFQNKLNRDAVWKAAKKLTNEKLERRSTGHCLLDPRYTFEGEGPDMGLGNDYQHSFANLYELAKPRSW
jgi:hypothetical protein